jgi:V/A-type H+/Na+-transporting ATPase subunit E
MSNNKENLEGLVSKLKEQGINAGKEEKQRLIKAAKEEAAAIISGAEKQSREILEEANRKAEQVMRNAQASIVQASRDMVEATRMSVLQYLKSVFGKQTKDLFTQVEYSKELLKAVMDALPGDKTVTVADNVLKEMESFILAQSLSEKVVLNPLGDNSTKIIVESSDKGDVQFVLSSQDIEEGLFTMLNKDLVERITKGKGE